VIQYEIGPLKNLVYLVIDWTTRKTLWVDPQADLSLPLQDCARFQLKTEGVLLTHTHPDHTAGVPGLLERFPQIPIYLHRHDTHRLTPHLAAGLKAPLRYLDDHESLSLGTLTIRALHSPGHSAGALTYLLDDAILTGDTIFIRDCGRTDLPTGSTREMFETLQRFRALNPKLHLFPGHHYQKEYWSTLEQELQLSPPFQCRSVEELEALP
jgi:glyoxylase-like metal-dependent hydrolase (beta-lactamase superfamily II)